LSACQKMFAGEAAPPAAMRPGKGPDPGRLPPRPVSYGGKTAQRAEELGLELSEEASAALASVPLRDAMDLLDSIQSKGTGKGGVRNPSNYIIVGVDNMTRGQPAISDKGYGKGKEAPWGGSRGVEDRVLELNRSGGLNEKIDVEALMALKRLPAAEAHEMLDAIETKGAGKGNIRSPSNYISAAVARMDGAPMGKGEAAPRKRPRAEYEEPPWQSRTPRGEGGKGGGGGSGRSHSRAVLERVRQHGLALDPEALDALSAAPEDSALYLLDQVSDQFDKIKNPSKYVLSACARGINEDEDRAAKRRR